MTTSTFYSMSSEHFEQEFLIPPAAAEASSSRRHVAPPPSPLFAASFAVDSGEHSTHGTDADNDDSSERHRRGQTYLVSIEEILQGYLQFDDDESWRFDNIRHHRFQVYKYILFRTLDTLHLRESVSNYFAVIGWELMSLNDFTFSMGFMTYVTDHGYLTALLEMPQDFDTDIAYEALTVPPVTITPRNQRVFLRRTAPQPPPTEQPHTEIHEVHGRLDSIEANLAEIMSYLRPSSSRHGHDRH
ncbi:hypothetical protein F3Y22_tig00110813pilonHSYRG00219 [Hibiscus syriacus]|uniref:Uncharacterized protein n=1 Tax=Hibiscus syriacus TaxID=106335 RepID=A0A6A2ZR49_HIBSY|nr:hypothetical protein F3Y22_tig00110813pilonHSYRG00219 [Hibiscus syriacus]